MEEKVIMLGNEAIARGAYEAGVSVSAAYPGTPSTEISENLIQYTNIYAEWSPNEKVALEVAIGASLSGVRSMACMKHVGVNVASDPLYTASYCGVNGGLVVVAADDPGLYSSQNEQDTRMIARSAHLPVLEPSDCEEAKEYMKEAFTISETYDTPVILRTTTRLSHSHGIVKLSEPKEKVAYPYEKNAAKYVMAPAIAKLRHLKVEEREKRLAEESSSFMINQIEWGDTNIGVITSGMAYQYVKEALPDVSILKLGMVNPLPKEMILKFAMKVKRLIVIEELEPVMEEQIASWGIQVEGKELFTIQGEYSANMIREAVLKENLNLRVPKNAVNRPPILCPGCPHRSVFTVLHQLKVHAAGDIGCYTLGAVPPLNVVDSVICMGASISTLHGMEKARGKEYIKDWVALIGDSTFLHTGINSLMNMVYNKSSATVIIMDNSTTGMTGHQDHAGTGLTLMKDKTNAISLLKLCRSLGIEHVMEINAFDIKKLKATIIEELKRDELSVIITKSPCVMLKKSIVPYHYTIQKDHCKSCLSCMIPGCPAISKDSDGNPKIHVALCTGCGLCEQLCHFQAIIKEEG
ncbi:indolepyruvate oxidoreductase subunit IorA [Lachnospiraceae bacterium KM106-2]|nr:indolepyruvate oxidoreductase subunit IorA [Lachnospiraceae bacterium KM106-2]